MVTSLLAHLYSHIKGSQEDVATLSLQYIVSRSAALNREFSRLLCRALHGDIGTELNYVCQPVGENLERPDIAGIDPNGKEQILCEAKFYAGLTDNQPNGYLDRLQKEGAYGLVFICPAARKVTLWSKLLELCRERSVVDLDEYCVVIGGVRMSILTWGDIVESLRHVASSEATDALPDIYQLDGFCRLMDSEAFVPLSPEDLGPEVSRKEERFYHILDALIDYLKADKSLSPSTKGVKATAYRQGYARAIKIRGYWLSINYDRDLWMNPASKETPFWVAIRSGEDWKQTDYILRALQRFPAAEHDSKWDLTYLALYPILYGTLDEIVASMKAQIIDYIDTVEETRVKGNIPLGNG